LTKVATCEWCGSTEVYFDAYVDINDEIVNVFESAYCAGECEDDIKHRYSITE
jgi:hypothetical protein